MSRSFLLPYGTGSVEVDVGPFRLETVQAPPTAAEEPPADPLTAALDHPVASPRLEALVSPGDRVLLVVSDGTRATAADRMVPALLERLVRAGVPDRDVRYIVAGGLHPIPDAAAGAALIGAEAARRLARVGGEAPRPADFVDLGATRRGTPVRLHRSLLEHDRVVLTGAISFHYYAGFTGGRKSILPGLAAPDTIAANHMLALERGGSRREATAAAGRLDDNPVHLDMAEACARIEPAFLVNGIVGVDGRLESAFAGHWDRAHREGCRELLRRKTVVVAGPRDLVLVSAGGHPRDIDLIQAHKAMEAARVLVRPGGAMVVLAACPRGAGHPQMAAWLDGRSAAVLCESLHRCYEVYGQTAHALRSKAEQIAIWLVSGAPDDLVRRAGLRPARDASTAVSEAAVHLGGGGGDGYVLERGAELLPVLVPPTTLAP